VAPAAGYTALHPLHPILLVSRAAGIQWQAENKNTLKTMEYSKIDNGPL
jgi:hypothetical protein